MFNRYKLIGLNYIYYIEEDRTVGNLGLGPESNACTDFTVSIPGLYKGPKREKTKAFNDCQVEHKFKGEAGAQLDEPIDLEKLAKEIKADLEATNKTSDLWEVFRPDTKRTKDLSIASPVEDDLPGPPR